MFNTGFPPVASPVPYANEPADTVPESTSASAGGTPAASLGPGAELVQQHLKDLEMAERWRTRARQGLRFRKDHEFDALCDAAAALATEIKEGKDITSEYFGKCCREVIYKAAACAGTSNKVRKEHVGTLKAAAEACLLKRIDRLFDPWSGPLQPDSWKQHAMMLYRDFPSTTPPSEPTERWMRRGDQRRYQFLSLNTADVRAASKACRELMRHHLATEFAKRLGCGFPNHACIYALPSGENGVLIAPSNPLRHVDLALKHRQEALGWLLAQVFPLFEARPSLETTRAQLANVSLPPVLTAALGQLDVAEMGRSLLSARQSIVKDIAPLCHELELASPDDLLPDKMVQDCLYRLCELKRLVQPAPPEPEADVAEANVQQSVPWPDLYRLVFIDSGNESDSSA